MNVTPTIGVPAERYQLLERIGAGGMGEVCRARDRRLDRMVALKVLPDSVAGDPVRRARFDRESRAIASLNHPHICSLHDVTSQDGRDWLVLEFIEGETLEDRLRSGPLPPSDVMRIGAELADALDAAHRAGIVHRDLKPSNVMLTASGVKLLDFGIAKSSGEVAPDGTLAPTASLTAERHILGTVRYMAPEQLEGRPVDGRADIFALGAVYSGRQLLYSSDRGGSYGVYRRSVDRSGTEELLGTFSRQAATVLDDVLRDDRHAIVDGAPGEQVTADIALVNLEDRSESSIPVFRTRLEGSEVRLSPSGRWIAYTSDVDGRHEVYVKAFPNGNKAPVRISSGGGSEPRWRADGRELYYLAPDRRLMAAAVRSESPLDVQVPVPLFACACDVSTTAGHRPAGRNQYDVTRDGRRFVVSETLEESPITVIVNWTALLTR